MSHPTKTTIFQLSLVIAFFSSSFRTHAWSSFSTPSRRQLLQQVATWSAATVVAAPTAWATTNTLLPSEETPRIVTRMGGLLEPFQDGPRGIRIMAPSGTYMKDDDTHSCRVYLLSCTKFMIQSIIIITSCNKNNFSS